MVYSTLDTFTAVVGQVTPSISWLPPADILAADILAAALTWLDRLHTNYARLEEGSKPGKLVSAI